MQWLSDSFLAVMKDIRTKADGYLYRKSIQNIEDAIRRDNTEEVLEILRNCKNEQVLRSALCCCISQNSISMLKSILCQLEELDINESLYKQSQCLSNHSPLHAACSLGHDEAVALLLESGFAINAVDEYHRTPLWMALSNGHRDAVDLLLSKENIDVNMVTSEKIPEIQGRNIPALMKAVIINDTLSVIGICKHNPDPEVIDCKRRTPLHYACAYGNIDCVTTLISLGSNVNVFDVDFVTPLYTACRRGHTDAVLMLLESGAQINYRPEEIMPVGYSLKYTPKVECFNSKKYAKYPLMASIENGHTDIVNILISKKAGINIKLPYERTPLHVACSDGTVDTVKALVDSGADINHRDSFGQTPIFFCMRNGKFQIGLRVYPLNKNEEDCNPNFRSYLDKLEEGNKIMTYLIQQGAIVNCKDANGLSPIDHAILTCRTVSSFILLKYGAKIQRNNYINVTPWTVRDIPTHEFPNEFLFRILLKHDIAFRKLLPTYIERSEYLTGDLVSKSFLAEVGQPYKLKDLCRIQIRNCICADTGLEFERNLRSLGLPNVLASFLMFEEMEHTLSLPNEIPEQL